MSSDEHLRRKRLRRPQESEDEEDDEDSQASRRNRRIRARQSRNTTESEDEQNAEQDSTIEADESRDEKSIEDGAANNQASASSSRQVLQTSLSSRVRGPDGYLPGSIVRIKLENFVTYDAVEFQPGPHLNMIMGPNGTGKSTIVCAIVLGLGWNPPVLGRAKDVGSFVKENCETGSIEIELKSARENQPNIIIERRLNSESNNSTFYLGGKKVNGTVVKNKIDELGIDVSNLCCFLPQDKVAHFAQMDAAELLKETQKAAGNEKMTEWHDTLIKLGSLQLRSAQELSNKQADLTNMIEKLDFLQRDVERAQERERLETMVESLSLAHAAAEYKDRKSLCNQLDAERKRVRDEQRQREAELLPLSRKLEELETSERDMKTKLEKILRSLRQDQSSLQLYNENLVKFETDREKINEKLASVRLREQDTKRVIDNLRSSISKLEHDTRQEPPRPETQAVDQSIRKLREDMRNFELEQQQAENQLHDISDDSKRLNAELDNVRRQLAELDNIGHMRLKMLETSDPHTFQAVKLIRQNATVFKEPVLGPVLVEVSIKKPELASAVESCINWATMKTFVCQNQEDYDAFGRMMDRHKLRVNFCDRGRAKQLHEFRRPTEQQELEALGFDNYMIDLIEAPDIILRYLCTDAHLHTIPVAANERAVDTQGVERSGKFQRYITGRHQHTITYSSYGSRQAQTVTRTLRPVPRTFKQSVDQTVRRRMDARIQAIHEEKAGFEEQTHAIAEKIRAHERNVERINREISGLEQKKGSMRIQYQMWEKAKVDLSTKKRALQAELQKPSGKAEERMHHAKLEELHDKSVKVLLGIKEILTDLSKRRAQADIDGLELSACQQRLQRLREIKNEQETQFNDINAQLVQLNARFHEEKEETRKLLRHAKEISDTASPDVLEKFREWEQAELNAAELLDRLNRAKGQLDVSMGVEPGVLQEYNRRKKEIEVLEKEVKALEQRKGQTDGGVSRVRSKWEPALRALVANINEKFSRAFRAIGNAGEVRIAEHEDYNKWGIDILVKFRDSEDLQKLNAHRQSGGERSISTITYLLSLTEMSRAPFSLVDEINQGMDQKYERLVHDHMVQVTCKTDRAGQYFLITPKLLPNLTYHERMRVLIINNGEWLPEKFDLRHYANIKPRVDQGPQDVKVKIQPAAVMV